MESDIFIKKWEINDYNKIIKYDLEILKKNKLSDSIIKYMIAGIPESAAPFLNFDNREVKPVSLVYPLEKSYDKYVIFGFNGSGDPICIDNTNDKIIFLNHDNNFEVCYLNRNLENFLEFLLIIRDFVDQYINDEENKEKYLNDVLIKMENIEKDDKWKRFWIPDIKMLIEE